MDATAYLLDRPRGGWDTLVTKDDLTALEARLHTELHREIREQTRWFATLVISALAVVVAAMAVIGAALRFA